MNAIQVAGFGPPEILRLTDLPDPGPGQVTIDVTHAASGLIDVFILELIESYRKETRCLLQ